MYVAATKNFAKRVDFDSPLRSSFGFKKNTVNPEFLVAATYIVLRRIIVRGRVLVR